LFLFDAKKKEPFGGGEPRQDRVLGAKKSIKRQNIDFYKINYGRYSQPDRNLNATPMH